MSYAFLLEVLKGGPTSGNWGHAGRPGKRGGSMPQSIAMSIRTGRDAKARQEAKRNPAPKINVPVNEVTKQKVIDHITSDYSKKEIDEALTYLNQVLDGAPVSMRVPSDVLAKIIKEDHFKNQHETGTSFGLLNPKTRADAERKAFGEDLENPQDFPVYGYKGTAKNGYSHSASGYGDVRVVFSDDVKSRTTVTVGDSLFAFSNGRQVGTPVLKPGIEGLDDNITQLNEFRRGDIDWNPGYIEAQIHGGLTTKDIKHVYVPASADEAIKALKDAGIPYTEYNYYSKDDPELMG